MTSETDALLDHLRVAVRRDAARGRRRRFVALAAAGVAVIATGVGAAGTFDDWWTGAEPAVQPAQLGEVAQENRSAGIELDLSKKATVARTGDAALDAVATNGGSGYCLSLFVGSHGLGGASCTTVSDSEYTTGADETHWIGYGRILDEGAVALDLSGAGLPAHVPLGRGGFFVFDIPRADWHALDGRTGDVSIVDAHGKTIRNACVYVGKAPGSAFPGGGGLGETPDTCAALKPLVSAPELDKARKLVSLTLAHDQPSYPAGDTITLWEAPNRGGGLCWMLGDGGSVPQGPASCGSSATPAYSAGLSSSLIGGHYANLVQGFADPRLDAVRAALVGAMETLPVSLANNAYLGELPDAPRAGKGSGPIPGGPWRLALYDAAGAEVASEDLPG